MKNLEYAQAELDRFNAIQSKRSLTNQEALEFLEFANWASENASALAKEKAATVEMDDPDWKTVPDWPEYQCSIHGNVRRVKRAFGARQFKILKCNAGSHDYPMASFSRPGQKKADKLVHRLIIETFVGPIPEGKDVCHYDGDRQNPVLSNLRIDTRKNNCADTIRHGRTPRGEKCGSNKYPRETILEIRSDYESGMKPRQIAKKFGIPLPTIYGITSRRNWFWL